MSGAEALAVLGVIASIISIIDGTKQVYDATTSAEGLPKAFREVAGRLPIITNTLGAAEQCIKEGVVSEASYKGVKQVIQACQDKATKLDGLFRKVIPGDNASRRERYLSAVRTLGKGNEVEKLMKGMLEDVQLLAGEHNMKIASNTQLEKIVKAISDVSAIPTSVPENGFQEPSFTANYSGSGNQYNAQGEYIAQGNARQYNSGGGPMHIDQRTFNTPSDSVLGEINQPFKCLLQEQDPVLTEKEDQQCIQHLRVTDPRDDKKRIEETKGGLLEDSYRWILDNPDFQQWRNDQQNRLLWIKGDPGKGKTMLLCGIVNELEKSMAKTNILSYFFCQASDSRINNATAVLRGLVFLLVGQQPSLISHIRKKHDHAGKSLFEDANAWVALSEIFANILQDSSLNNTYLVIDALDECVAGLPKLLDFIVQKSSVSPRVKWIVSSRNDTNIERRLRLDDSGVRLSLELKENAEQVSRAVDTYIDYCLQELTEIQYDKRLQDSVREKMRRKANGTFLWVSLVIEELKDVMSWEMLQVLDEVPLELRDIYHRMIERIKQLQRQQPELCRQVLSIVIAAYRPLHLQELHVLSGLPAQVRDINQSIAAIVKMCGSFLTIRDDSVYIIHQSAKDFLSQEASPDIFPCGVEDVHYSIFLRSLETMSKILRRDMYSLRALGYPIEQVKHPDPDPLAVTRYSCIHWVDHLCDWNSNCCVNHKVDLQDKGMVDVFIREKYLYWLEALSLCRSMSDGVVSMAKLEALIEERADASALIELVRDARRFIMYHKWAIENSPLQAYASALLFSPAGSLTRGLFMEEEPKWITIKPAMGDKWSACLQTLEGHSHGVRSVAFSHDSTRLASASDDSTVKIWDARSGECLQTLEGHSHGVNSVAFSHDSTRLASASEDSTVKIWDARSGECLQTLEGHSGWVRSVAFSHDSTRLASASEDSTVKIWDARSGECLQTLDGHSNRVYSVAFSHDSTRLASASYDRTVKIWDASSGEWLQTLDIGKILQNVSFDTTGSYLHTNIGTIDIDASSASNMTPNVADPQNPRYQGWALSSGGAWITYNSTNRVWLPSEYRPSCSAVLGTKIGIGVGSGKVWICNFKVDNA